MGQVTQISSNTYVSSNTVEVLSTVELDTACTRYAERERWSAAASPEWLAGVGYLEGTASRCAGPEAVWGRVERLHRAIRLQGTGCDERWLAFVLGFTLGRRDAGRIDNRQYGLLVQRLSATVAHGERPAVG